MEDEQGGKDGLYSFEEERGEEIRRKKRFRFEEDIFNENQF